MSAVSDIKDRSPLLDQAEEATLRQAYGIARRRLLAERSAEGFWAGELSSSALATAVAVSALSVVSREKFGKLIAAGIGWLGTHQNPDGGWGDSPRSPSNVPTTMLAEAAFRLAAADKQDVEGGPLEKAEGYLRRNSGRSAQERIGSLRALYGADRTFAVPILTTCALAEENSPLHDAPASADGQPGVVWTDVPRLPFELACLPHSWLRRMRLHVVSYALPALVAIGQLVDARRPTRNPLLRLIRGAASAPALRRLEAIQPASGGFLEAVPLTGFVVMSLAAAGNGAHPVCRRGLAFLERSVRPDGSWPVDTNLSVWLTTQAVSALKAGPHTDQFDLDATAQWLLDCQHTTVCAYADSQPGAWGWTHLPGSVPDVDDTSGALLALAGGTPAPAASAAAARGVAWLLDLQNADGGWPTFCRGWGKLPFDRSAPDLTAHALRALAARRCNVDLRRERRAIARGFDYLRRTQRPDGSWTPLWFGNQHAPGQENPVYGTARVLAAYLDVGLPESHEARRGAGFLLNAQNPDGSWGGDRGVPGSMEETALAVDALVGREDDPRIAEAVRRGCRYLADRMARGGLDEPSPIGLYFASLWYFEKLYPIIWTVAALGRVIARCAASPARPRQHQESPR